MLSVTDLACSRGGRPLFRPLNFSLAPGQWMQVMGNNGAGKTTLLRTLVGLSTPEQGRVMWQGRPLAAQLREFRRASCYLGHHAAVKDELTPIENLQTAAALDGQAVNEAQARDALETLGLAGCGRLPTRFLSAGQKRRVLLSRLLLRPAALWVLDEPFAALDTTGADLLGQLLARHLAGGGMALLSSHQPVPLPPGSVVAL
ncbi:cytochrome c biogenesis heme-transporting ATPase CcmA [Pelomonas cellulosilytica]|uniref:Cytochrome c biogenesis heme-transporting ATPase CcmA n=1 Tax=Pelomonas cellulosilytica TaxID=2906762 RepID=A0ABS8XPZ4_9BURK|nr:cytochrome c biogenesis heme-transporting ATPase CcmA [Pelomonas sp. P8]MCE4552916.1 cytochrome c biogenesis heme-transporting ATPase CcmA [Pelomonas sp. P8]